MDPCPGYSLALLYSQEYLKHSGLDYTILITSIFFENVINYTMYQKQPDGSLVMGDNLGTEPHAWHAVGDIGLTVAGVRAVNRDK